MKSYQQLFAELKRRKVFRVMAAYGVIGFGASAFSASRAVARVGLDLSASASLIGSLVDIWDAAS